MIQRDLAVALSSTEGSAAVRETVKVDLTELLSAEFTDWVIEHRDAINRCALTEQGFP